MLEQGQIVAYTEQNHSYKKSYNVWTIYITPVIIFRQPTLNEKHLVKL